jgi:hypothetical protein
LGALFAWHQIPSKYGEIMGSKEFLEKAEKRFDRREQPNAVKKKRIDDKWFKPVEKVIYEFEKKHGVDIDNLKIDNYQTKRLRGELSVYLKDYEGLKYREVIEFGTFDDLQ